jgi:hypothetical protein
LLIPHVDISCTTINVAQLSTLGTVSLPETTQATTSSDQTEIQDTNSTEIEKNISAFSSQYEPKVDKS